MACQKSWAKSWALLKVLLALDFILVAHDCHCNPASDSGTKPHYRDRGRKWQVLRQVLRGQKQFLKEL